MRTTYSLAFVGIALVAALVLTWVTAGCIRGADGAAAPAAGAIVTKDLLANGAAAAGVRLGPTAQPGAALAGQEGKFVKAPLPANQKWSGITLAMEKAFDARVFTSLKFDVFLDAPKTVRFSIRIDDAESIETEYRSQFNLGGGQNIPELQFKPGRNQLRLSVERIFNGVVNNPPVDVSRLVKIILFAKADAAANLYVRRVWFERVPPPAGPALLVDFTKGQWRKTWTADPADLVITEQVDPAKGRKLVVKAHPPGSPGWALGATDTDKPAVTDWQAYDQLVLAYANPLERIVSAGITIADDLKKEIIFCYRLPPGIGEIEIPLASAQTINLERIAWMSVWFGARRQEEYEVYVRRLSLKRTPGQHVILGDAPAAQAGPGDWVIDLSRFYNPSGDRLLADIILPRVGRAEPLILKCRPDGTRARTFILPARYARSCRTGGYRAQGFCINHGQTLLYYKDDRPIDAAGRKTIKPIRGLGP